MKLPNLLQLRESLGGESFLDRKLYFAFSPVVVVNSVLVSNHEPSPFNWAMLLIANLIAILICWFYFEFAIRVVFKNKNQKPVSLFAIGLFGISMGALKAVSTAVAAWAIHFETDLARAIINRIVQTSLLGLMLVFAAAAISSAQRRYQAERDLLVTQKVQQNLNSNFARDYSKAATTELRSFVSQAKQRLVAEGSNSSAMIRSIIEDSLRPLSHKLWERENAKFANYEIADLIRLAIRNNRYFATTTALIYFVVTVPFVLIQAGWSDAILRSLLGSAIILIFFTIAARLRTKSFSASLITFVSVIMATDAAVIAASSILLGELEGYNAWSMAVAVLFWLAEVNLFLGITAVMRENHKEIREKLASVTALPGVAKAVKNSTNLILNRELANYLHGSLQNRLLSSAVRIERSGDDPNLLLAELEQLEQLLENVGDTGKYVSNSDLSLQLQQLQQSWAGFVAIIIENSLPNAGAAGSIDFVIGQVVNEAISNSVRHGLAKNIRIQIEQDGQQIKLRVLDDGLGPRENKPGLGSKYFDSVAGTNWKIAPGANGGSELTLTLTL
jgi:hypothetical protein